MAIQIPIAGAVVYQQFLCTSTQTIADGIKTALVAAGWTSGDQTESITVTFNANPSNTQTITINGTTYTAVTGAPGTNQFQIGANAAATAANFAALTFSNATASASGAVVTITSTQAGFAANSRITYSNSLSNVVTADASYRGYKITCAATPQGLMAALYVIDSNRAGSFLYFAFGSADGSLLADSLTGPSLYRLTVSGGRTLEISACAHQFMTWLLANNSSGTRQCVVGMCVPYLHESQAPVTITNVSVSGTTVTVTASSAMPLVVGSDVYISEVTGMTGVNGFWTLTGVSGSTFTFTSGSAGGSYGASSGLVGSFSQLSRCFFGWSDETGDTFRNDLCLGWAFVCANQYSYNYNSGVGNNGGRVQLIFPRAFDWARSASLLYSFGGISLLSEPLIGWAPSAIGATYNFMGQMWIAFVVTDTVTLDYVKLGFNGHDCVNVTDGSSIQGSLFFLKN